MSGEEWGLDNLEGLEYLYNINYKQKLFDLEDGVLQDLYIRDNPASLKNTSQSMILIIIERFSK